MQARLTSPLLGMSLIPIRRDSLQVKLDPEDGAICTYTEIFGGKSCVREGSDLQC